MTMAGNHLINRQEEMMKKLVLMLVIVAATLSLSAATWAWNNGNATGDGDPPGWSQENPGKGGTGD